MDDSSERAARDPLPGGWVVRLWRGASYLLEGWSFVFGRHPSLLKYCLLPLAINILIFAGVAIGIYAYGGELARMMWARPESWLARALWYTTCAVLLLLALLLACLIFFVVQALLAAPFNDLLSERVETLATGCAPPPFQLRRFLYAAGQSLLHELIRLGIYVGVTLPLFVLSLAVPVVGQLAWLVGGFYLSCMFFAYQALDYCMVRRAWSFARKWRALGRHRALSVGFGAALAGSLLVPGAGLLAGPMAAVGGTLLFCDLERRGAFAGGDKAAEDEPRRANCGI